MPATRCWLVKSEPEAFSFSDLLAAPKKTTSWNGVRNYLARNYMRDLMKKGDQVLFYHSNADPTAIVGVAEVAREAYPDPEQFDPKSEYFDPKSKREAPTWVMVDIKAVKKLKRALTLAELKETKGLEKMVLLQKGSRLSVQPVTTEEFDVIVSAASRARSPGR